MFFHFEPLSIPDVIRITPARHDDDRGFFSETYRVSAFEDAGIKDVFLQDSHARSTRGVENPTLSARDLSLPGLESATSPFQYVQ